MTVGGPITEFADLIATRIGCGPPQLVISPDVDNTEPLPTDIRHGVIRSVRKAVGEAKPGQGPVVVVDWDWIQPARGFAGWLLKRGVEEVLHGALVSVVSSASLGAESLELQLTEGGTSPVFSGSFSHGEGAGAAVCICESSDGPSRYIGAVPPQDFSVVAFMTTFNERDVIEPILADLRNQGIEAYVFDNWSTDGTWETVQEYAGRGVIGCERWPEFGPPRYFDLEGSLERMLEVSHLLGADWYIKHDADEIRRSPWSGISVRDALWAVQLAEFNVVDFTVLNYPPIDNGYSMDIGPWEYFLHFEFGSRPGHFRQLKAWRYQGQEVEYARSGSHKVSFSGMRVFPYKFEVHHYPIRSQDHGVRKVLSERQGRYLPSAKRRGWHNQYDDVDHSTNFLRSTEGLEVRNEVTWRCHLLERLGGIGLPGNR